MDRVDQGYDDNRFEKAVDGNFHCTICMKVLKDPVQCRRNEHYFCKPCITRHLEKTSQTCPSCTETLSVETLKEPSRIVTNYLSLLKINCEYVARGCRALVQLGNLKTHVQNCNFSPMVCSTEGCLMIINKGDKEHHQTQVCKFRKVKCHDCGEEVQHKKYKSHGCVMRKEMDDLKMNLVEMRDQLKKLTSKTDQMQCILEEVMKEVKNMKPEQKEERKKVTKPASTSSSGGDIVIVGGRDGTSDLNSAEMFSCSTRTWTSLPPMKQRRSGPSSFVYKSQLVVSGGRSGNSCTDGMERMNVNEEPKQWFNIPANLPFKCSGHRSVICQNRLIITGGYNEDADKVSDGIYEVLITPPYTSKLLCRMPQARACHGAVPFDDKILIVGGKTTGSSKDCVESILVCDITRNTCKQMAPLPYAVTDMATVCYRGALVMIGGWDKSGNVLNKVVMYNIKTGECKMLPSMNIRRIACSAVVTNNAIVVMGGKNEKRQCLNSVECFSFERRVWKELPSMTVPRAWATAVVKPVV